MDNLDAVERGEDPKAVIRDPNANACIRLPVAERRAMTEGLPLEELQQHPFLGEELRRGYPFQAGQPDEIRRLLEEAMGIAAAP